MCVCLSLPLLSPSFASLPSLPSLLPPSRVPSIHQIVLGKLNAISNPENAGAAVVVGVIAGSPAPPANPRCGLPGHHTLSRHCRFL
jgi:hypothetical protein